MLPGITHWQSPGWFAYFPANASGPASPGDPASAGLGVQGMLWATSPACTEIELRVAGWLVDLLGLPEHSRWRWAPAAARSRGAPRTPLTSCTWWARHLAAAPADRLVAYGSSQAHFSVHRGARVAGFAHVATCSGWPTGGPLNAALSGAAPYMSTPTSESGAVVDLRGWQLSLGRRFRALKLWSVLRAYGARGLRHHVAEHLRLAGELAEW